MYIDLAKPTNPKIPFYRNKLGRFVKGCKMPLEICLKISKGRKGIKFTEKHKQNMSKNNYWKGKILPLEIRKKISQTKIGKKGMVWLEERKKIISILFKGKNNPAWKGGLPKCVKCGRQLSNRRAKRCQKCFIMDMIKYGHPKPQSILKGKSNPRWNRIKINCNFCNKEFYIKQCLFKEGHNSCSRKCVSSILKQIKGENHPLWKNNNPQWKGGITLLSFKIRALPENRNWIKKIFIRDNFICQKCKQFGGKLEAHHKKPFAIILQEFLQQYSQFSPIEDKETLVRLALTYEPFWDIDNGITLCKNCHKRNVSLENIVL